SGAQAPICGDSAKTLSDCERTPSCSAQCRIYSRSSSPWTKMISPMSAILFQRFATEHRGTPQPIPLCRKGRLWTSRSHDPPTPSHSRMIRTGCRPAATFASSGARRPRQFPEQRVEQHRFLEIVHVPLRSPLQQLGQVERPAVNDAMPPVQLLHVAVVPEQIRNALLHRQRVARAEIEIRVRVVLQRFASGWLRLAWLAELHHDVLHSLAGVELAHPGFSNQGEGRLGPRRQPWFQLVVARAEAEM